MAASSATKTSDWTTTYSRSTSGSPPSGSTMTAPCMPAAMWALMGIVEQWYIHTPARPAVNRYVRRSPGAMVRIGPSGFSAPAWKSIEWPIEPSLISVISKASPTRPRSVGPTPEPLKVHRFCHTPGATSSGTSVTRNSKRRTVSAVSGGATGSTMVPSSASGSPAAAWPGSPSAGSAVGSTAGAPATTTSNVMPICRCPTTVHHPDMVWPTTPRSSSALSPGASRPVRAVPMSRSWTVVGSSLTSSMITRSPG